MISTRITPWTIKLLWLTVPSLIGGAAWWYAIQQALVGHVLFEKVSLFTLLLFAVVCFAFLALWLGPLMIGCYLSTWRSVRLLMAAVISLPILIFFPFNAWTLISLVVVMVGLAWGVEAAADDGHNRLAVQPHNTFGHAAPAMILAIMIAISLLYYQQLRGSASTPEQLSAKLINQTVTIIEKFLPRIYSEYRPGMTVDELIGAQIPSADTLLKNIDFKSFKSPAEQEDKLKAQISNLGLNPDDLDINLRTSEQELRRELDAQLVSGRQETIKQARDELGKRFNTTLVGSETVNQVIADIIGRQFNTNVKQFVNFIPALLAVALFLILRILTIFFQISMVWGGWVIYHLMKWFHILHVTHQTVPAEKLEWVP